MFLSELDFGYVSFRLEMTEGSFKARNDCELEPAFLYYLYLATHHILFLLNYLNIGSDRSTEGAIYMQRIFWNTECSCGESHKALQILRREVMPMLQ